MSRSALVLALALGLLVGGSPPRADACARVYRAAEPVVLEGEEALIVWDPETRTEHFIRSGLFSGATADFGFLVPTPSRPELGEVPGAIFSQLYDVYHAPPLAPRRRGGGGGRGVRTRALTAPSVRVLEQRVVAGLDATVLAAADAGALDRWLAQHGYPAGPELRAWLAPYVERGWIVTAFRYDPAGSAGAFASSAVRMSFETDRPFFPYSEPAGGDHRPRPFRVSVIAPTRTRAMRPFRGRVGYADALSPSLARSLLAGVLPSYPFGEAGAFLTVHDEPRSVRGSEDLFFRPAQNVRRRSTLRTRIVGHGAPRPPTRSIQDLAF